MEHAKQLRTADTKHCIELSRVNISNDAKGHVAPKQTLTVGSTLGWSQKLTNGRKTGSLYHAMPEAGAAKMGNVIFCEVFPDTKDTVTA